MLERILIGLTFVTVFFLIVETLTFRSLWKVYQGMPWWPTMKMVWWGVHIVVWAAFLAAFFMWPTWRGTHPVLLKGIMSVTFALTIPKLFVCVIQQDWVPWACWVGSSSLRSRQRESCQGAPS